MTLIDKVRLVTPAGIQDDAWILVEGESILETGSGPRPEISQMIDGGGLLAMPGFIDLHSDALEGETQPRPGVFLETELGFFSLEAKLVCHGVTTMYHSLSFHDHSFKMRTSEVVQNVIRCIDVLKKDSIIHHRVHARYEVSETPAESVISDLIDEGLVHMVSLMNHSPGQGQYVDMEKYRNDLYKTRGFGPAEADQWIRERQARMQNPEIPATMKRLADKVLAAGIPLASHDDDSAAKIERMRSYGVGISEFPIDLLTAKAAREAGMHIVVGAPNIVRGASNSGNMRAIDAILAGAADILCSDYVPPAILHAVFKLHTEYGMPLHEASAMASLNPARAVGLGELTGSIENGKQADIILVDDSTGVPRVLFVMTMGQPVLTKGRRFSFAASASKEAEHAR